MNRKHVLSLVGVLFSAATASTGDASNYLSLGFSADGQHYAYVESGVQDGSGFPYATASVVDVARNEFAIQRRVVLQTDGATESAAIQKAVSQVNLGSYKIKKGDRIGTDLVVRQRTDLTTYTGTYFTPQYWAQGGDSAQLPIYEVVVTETKAPSTPDTAECEDTTGNTMVKVSIAGLQGTDNKIHLLQEDRFQPRVRFCGGRYTVHRVSMHGESVIVALSYMLPGFEGPNYRYLVVSGRVNLTSAQ